MTIWDCPKRWKIVNRTISILLIQAFLLSNVAFALPTKSNIEPIKKQDVIATPDSVIVPRDFGLVKNKFTGNSGKLIIHIQDAHCNYEAQSNIVKIVETLIKNYNLGLVSVEGADGFIDTSWFKTFPDDEVRKEVADYFMKKGEITGPEFLSITTNLPFKLFGAETRSYYIQNLNAFTSSYPLKGETEKYFNSIKKALDRLKGFIYSEELKSLDAKIQDYESKKIQFNDYVRFLQALAEHHKINLRAYENFFRLMSVLIYEKKIDFNVTDKERGALIDEISKSIDKDQLQQLVTQSITFKSGKISSAEYYAYLKNLAAANAIDLSKKYPNLYNYIIYNAVYSKIENDKLFQDLKNIEIAIKEKLYANDDQRTLEKLSRHIEILLGLINIKLMNGDFDYYEANKGEFSSQYFEDFLRKKTVQYGLAYEIAPPTDAVIQSIPKLEDFYSIAIKRDKALVDNTLTAMKSQKQQIAVLVTGGFHSEGIAKLLEKEGVSYMVVCPSITKDVPTPYIEILTNQRTPLENILVGTAHAKEANVAAPSRAQLITMTDAALRDYTGRLIGGDQLKLVIGDIEEGWAHITVSGAQGAPTPVGKVNIKGVVERLRKDAGADIPTIINELRRDLHERCRRLKLPGTASEHLLGLLEEQLVSPEFKAIQTSFEEEYNDRKKERMDLEARREGRHLPISRPAAEKLAAAQSSSIDALTLQLGQAIDTIRQNPRSESVRRREMLFQEAYSALSLNQEGAQLTVLRDNKIMPGQVIVDYGTGAARFFVCVEEDDFVILDRDGIVTSGIITHNSAQDLDRYFGGNAHLITKWQPEAEQSLKAILSRANEILPSARTSPGTNAVNGDNVSPKELTYKEARMMDEILHQSFADKTYRIVTAEELGFKELGDFQFVVHYGLEARIEKYNKEHGTNLPTDRVHPGRGGEEFQHGLRQGHISSFRFENIMNAGKKEILRIVGTHELAHIQIANKESSPAYKAAVAAKAELESNLINEEDVVDYRVPGANTRVAYGWLPGNVTIRDYLANIDAQRKRNAVYQTEEAVLMDTAFGTAARDEIVRLRKEGKEFEAGEFARTVYEHRANIDRMKKVLTEPYNGYDVIIISSTTEGEAEDQQAKLDKIFGEIKTANREMGNKVCVLSVLDTSEGNNLIGQNNTWVRAQEAFKKWAVKNNLPETDLKKLQSQKKAKVVTYHNGGKAERFSPAGQALNLSRADQLLAGNIFNKQGEPIELNLLLSVILSTAGNAVSNDGSRHDVYWANQIEFGTVPNVERRDYAFNKFAVALPANPDMKDLYDYGTLIATPDGRILKFLGNKRLTMKGSDGKYIPNPDWQAQYDELMEAARQGRAYLDYGSFSMSLDMQNALLEYWRDVKGIFNKMKGDSEGKAGISREIDPHMTMIMAPIINGCMGKEKALKRLPTVKDLDAAKDKDAVLEKAYRTLLGIMTPEFRIALEDLYKKATKDLASGKNDNLQAIYETIEFFIRYKDKVDMSKGFGIIDFGPGSYWFAYKRLLDMGNEKFLMLADLTGKNIVIEPDGNVPENTANVLDRVRAEDARRLRSIREDAVCVFEANGHKVTLTAEQVRNGWKGYGVTVKGSIIQGNTVLSSGSVVINSVVNNSQGAILAVNSYIESSASPVIDSENSIIINAIDEKEIPARKEIVADAYRPAIHDTRFPDGQTRMRAPVGYDPKPGDKAKAAVESDGVKFGDNVYTFAEIRNMPCDKAANMSIFKRIKRAVLNIIHRAIDARFTKDNSPTMSIRYQESKKRFSRSTFGEQLVFGTSGIRELVKFMEDIKCYSIARAIASYFKGMNEPDKIALAADLRPSSPRITQDMIMGHLSMGKDVIYAGNIPTPAVVNYGMYKKYGAVPSAMVTASHCPVLPEAKHQNGIKPNRTTGEVLKQDERLILKHVREFMELEFMMNEADSMFDAEGKLKENGLSQSQEDLIKKAVQLYSQVQAEAEDMYVDRYTDAFGEIFDSSDDIDFIQHMSVGKTIFNKIMANLKAKLNSQIDQTQWQEGFVVDTEDLQPKLKEAVKKIVQENQKKYRHVKGIFTTDGDSDRPALFCEDGEFVYGDKLGYLTCEYIRSLASYNFPGKKTPKFFAAVTATVSNAVIERLQHIGFEVEVVKIGSPYVVKAMEDRMAKARAAGEEVVCMGFERNGGFLLGSDITLNNGKVLKALPTRDAALPIIAAFALAKTRPIEKDRTKTNGTIGQLVNDRFSGDYASYGWSGLIEAKAGMGEYCDLYTANMGQAIMRSFSPRNLDIVEVKFNDDGGVTRLTKSGEMITVDKESPFAVYMNDIKVRLEGHFKVVNAFTGDIIKINYLDGVRMFFKNKMMISGQTKDVTEIVHMRPSGNAPQWRIYSEAATQERAEQITGYRLPVYPNIIKEYLENKKKFEGVHIVPRTNDKIKKTFDGIFDQNVDVWTTWAMNFGPQNEHRVLEGIVFGLDNKSIAFHRNTVYDLVSDKTVEWLPKEGFKLAKLTVDRSIRWDRERGTLVCHEEWSDGRNVSVEYKAPDAWLEIGKGLDKNIPMGKFQDMPFPVMSDKARAYFKQNGIFWLDLFDVSVESEFTIEAPMWAHNFNFEQAEIAGEQEVKADELRVTPGKYAVSTERPEAVMPVSLARRDMDRIITSIFNNYATGEDIVEDIFKYIDEPRYLGALAGVSNELNKRYAAMTTEERNAAWPQLERFYAAMSERALSVNDIGVAKGLQIMIGNTIALQNLIDNGVVGAEKIMLTANPAEMLKAADVDRGPSYISGLSIPQEMLVAVKEGAQGIYWRGAEGISKLGPNVLDEMGYAENKSQLDRLVMYTMLHINGFHTTVFLHDRLPGSIQHISTGKGHFQSKHISEGKAVGALDIKRVTRGEVLQFNDLYNYKGRVAETLVQKVKPGEWARALPCSMDYMVPLTRIAVFNDISVEVNDIALVKSLNPNMAQIVENGQAMENATAEGVTKAIPAIEHMVKADKVANYIVVNLNGKPTLVANNGAPEVTQIGQYNDTYGILRSGIFFKTNMAVSAGSASAVQNLIEQLTFGKNTKPQETLNVVRLENSNITGYARAISALYTDYIRPGKPFKVLPLLKTYPWGVSVDTVKAAHNYIMENLGMLSNVTELNKLIKGTGVQIKETDNIGESWLGKGVIVVKVGDQEEYLPVEVLSLFGSDVYGVRNVEDHGAMSGITAKILQASTDLSWQIHLAFAEKVTALEKTTVYVGLSNTMTEAEFIKATKEGRTDIFNEVTLNPGETLIVPAKCPHAYKAGSVVVEFKDIDMDSPSQTYSFYDRGRLTQEEKAVISNAVRQANYDVATARASIKSANPELYAKLFDEENGGKNPLIRPTKDGLTTPQETLEKIASEIGNAGYLNKVEPAQLIMKNPILVSPKETKDEARAEIIGITEGSVGMKYTIQQGRWIWADTISLGSGQPLTVLKGRVRIMTEGGRKEDVEKGGQLIIPHNAKKYTIESLDGEAVIAISYMPTQPEALMNTGFEAMRANLAAIRSQRVNLLTTSKAFRKGDVREPGTFRYEQSILSRVSDGKVQLTEIRSSNKQELIDSLKSLVKGEEGVNYVVQLTEDELKSIRDNPEMDTLLNNIRVMPLPNVKFSENLGIPFIREIESAGVVLGNTTEKDINDKTIIAGWLKNIMSKLTGNKVIDWGMLTALLRAPQPGMSFTERMSILLKNLQVKIQQYEADKELRGRRELLWSV